MWEKIIKKLEEKSKIKNGYTTAFKNCGECKDKIYDDDPYDLYNCDVCGDKLCHFCYHDSKGICNKCKEIHKKNLQFE